MTRRLFAFAAPLLALAGCASQTPLAEIAPSTAVDVQVLALNDFHGNLERPAEPIRFRTESGELASARAGGAAAVGEELRNLRFGHDHSITVAAGDLIGASPLTSAYFLDEPTIEAMNMMGLSLAAVGNHEFDKGSAELLRMQKGGCERHVSRLPCRLEPFKGATFEYLAANVVTADGETLFPAAALRKFGPITIGFIGETLKETSTLVTPAGVAGLRFGDEAAAANALVPALKAKGADAIVLLLHQGGRVTDSYRLTGCDGLSGEVLPILDKLDPAITTIISGHTHNAYECEIEAGGTKRLLTSAGKYGYFITDLRLAFDSRTHRLLAQSARNVPMIRSTAGDPEIAALVDRYSKAVAPVADRVIGHLSAAAPRSATDGESPAADMIADSILAATASPDKGGARIALVNASGVRVGLPSGDIRYGDAFAMMPFGNNLVVMTLTGAQLKAVLEQQYSSAAAKNAVLAPSAGFTYAVDLSKPEGSRISDMRLAGKPIALDESYRVAVNNYLASGGDGLSRFTSGTGVTDAGIIDVDAFVDWIGKVTEPPPSDRIRIRP